MQPANEQGGLDRDAEAHRACGAVIVVVWTVLLVVSWGVVILMGWGLWAWWKG